ncbi:MAG: carbohydrate kinase family protein [bacterium]
MLKPSNNKIYVSGSMAYDRIMDFPGRFSDHILPDKLHILNVCFTVNGMKEKFGGTAGNIAYSLSLLEEKPIILSTIGKDYSPYFNWLKYNNISTETIKIIEDEFTASAYITTDQADNQITGFNPGAMKYPSDFDFEDGIDKNSIAIISPGNLTDMINYAKRYKEAGIRYICDPGQSLTAWDGKALSDWIEGSYILITNDYELELVMKITSLKKEELLKKTAHIITTLGEKGALISFKNEEIHIKPAKVKEVLDPTGAGDAFRAGLIKGIVNGMDIETSAKLGAVAATYAIEQYGTQEHYYTIADFIKRYNENY